MTLYLNTKNIKILHNGFFINQIQSNYKFGHRDFNGGSLGQSTNNTLGGFRYTGKQKILYILTRQGLIAKYDMTMWSNGNIFRVIDPLCEGNPLVYDGFPSHRPVTRSLDIFFEMRLIKQSRSWWFATPSRSLWRHCNGVASLHERHICSVSNRRQFECWF